MIVRALLATVVLAMATTARAQDRNDTNDPPPLPRPTPAQVVGLRRLERLARYLEVTADGTSDRFVRRELALPRATPVDKPAMARYFALTEEEAWRLLGGTDPPGPVPEGGPAAAIRRHLHWWGRYVDWSARRSTP